MDDLTVEIDKENKLILCAGIPRSGSTWMYNIIRLALQKSDCSVYCAWIDDYDPCRPEFFHLVKVHEAIQEDLLSRSDLIFCSYRDLRDIAASSVKMEWVSEDAEILSLIERIIVMHHFWRVSCNFEMCYEQMFEKPIQVAADIIMTLGLELEAIEVEKICKQVDKLSAYKGNEVHDPETLLHVQHRHSGQPNGYLDVLSESLVTKLEQQFGWWLSHYRYINIEQREGFNCLIGNYAKLYKEKSELQSQLARMRDQERDYKIWLNQMVNSRVINALWRYTPARKPDWVEDFLSNNIDVS